MTDLRKAAEMALEFVDWLCGDDHSVKPKNNALKTREALRQALAQPEQEPVGYIDGMYGGYMVFTPINPSAVYLNGTALYTAPPKREWVGLTEDETDGLIHSATYMDETDLWHLVSLVAERLKEKNGG